MQYGTTEDRNSIVNELESHVIELSKSKYGKFMVPKMLTYGTKEQRGKVIARFYGHVRKLIKHRTAAPVVALCYIDFATSEQRSSLLQEFYGPDFTLFKMSGNMKSLEEILEVHPGKKASIVKHLREALVPLLEKGLCSHHIVHRALSDYLQHAEGPERIEMLDTIQELLPEMIHTREGARITMISIRDSDAKNRKLIIRALKPYVTKICLEQYGHVALCAVFDAVDDTVLVSKQIIATITADIADICESEYGRKVLLYLLTPRNSRYFMPEILKQLEAGDGSAHSKKRCCCAAG